MVNVIYQPNDLREPFKEGISDMKRIDEFYVKVDGQLRNIGTVHLDTPKNREILTRYVADYKAWKELEPNPYAMLNSLDKWRL